MADARGTIEVTYRKWPDLFRWGVDMEVLERTPGHAWCGTRVGTPIRRRGPTATASGNSVALFLADRWFSPRWYAEPQQTGRAARFSCYVDITAPATLTDDAIELVDLELDVALTWDGDIVLLDQDEFDERRGGYPSDVVTAAVDAACWVTTAMHEDAWPFDGSHAPLLDGWRRRCTQTLSAGVAEVAEERR